MRPQETNAFNGGYTPRHLTRQYALLGHNAAVFGLAAGDTPHSFYSAAGDGWIVRWDLAENPELGRLTARVDTQLFSLCRLPQQGYLVAGNMYGGVHWISPAEPEATRNVAAHQGKGVFALLPIAGSLLSAGGDGRLIRWDAASGRSAESLQLSGHSLRTLAYCPQRHELAVGASDCAIYLLDAATLSLKTTIPGAHQSSVFALAYSPDGLRLLSGSRDARLCCWYLGDQEPRCEKTIEAHWFTINDLAFSPDGQWVATASRDKTVKIWDAQSLELLKVLELQRDNGHRNSVNRLLWMPDGQALISAGDDRAILVWHFQAG